MPGDSIDTQAVRAELERVLASKRFLKSEPLSRLLRFLVEHAVGDSAPLDERSIAIRVFRRPDAFVPQLDPIVRVQSRRLRAALLAYYQGDGGKDPVVLAPAERGYGLIFPDPLTYKPYRSWGRAVKYVGLAAAVVLGAGLWLYFRPHTTDPRAIRLDRQARALRAKGTPAEIAQAATLFQQAVEIDSRYAPAWSGLADVLLTPDASVYMTTFEALDKSLEAAGTAIKLDPRIGEAHAVVAYIRFVRDSNWAGAEPEFRRAIELDPSAAATHALYAQGLMSRGRFDEAIFQAEVAGRLAPPGSPPSTDLATILCAARRYEEAIPEARRVVQATGGAPRARLALGIVLAGAGRYDESIPEFQSVLISTGSLYALARLGYAQAANGDLAAGRMILTRLDQAFASVLTIDWSYRALIYAGLGDAAHAVDSMEKGLMNQEGDVNFIGVDPAFDKIRFDPRFVALRKRLGLP